MTPRAVSAASVQPANSDLFLKTLSCIHQGKLPCERRGFCFAKSLVLWKCFRVFRKENYLERGWELGFTQIVRLAKTPSYHSRGTGPSSPQVPTPLELPPPSLAALLSRSVRRLTIRFVCCNRSSAASYRRRLSCSSFCVAVFSAPVILGSPRGRAVTVR